MKTTGKSRARKPAQAASTATFEQLVAQPATPQAYVLRLFITGTTPRSAQAIANIRSLCDEYLAGYYDLEVVDIYQQPDQAAVEQIIAAPTLIKKSPIPAKRMIGDLSNREKIIVGLDLPSPPQLPG